MNSYQDLYLQGKMPLINVMLSTSEVSNQDELLKELSQELSLLTKKPEKYVMGIINQGVSMIFAGKSDPCCYIEIKSIGSLNPSKITNSISKIINARTNINLDRIYICFEDIKASQWGYNGETFG